jgi:phosphoribosylformimino-5-aminoimidazole carboxamide ribotide isomerase
MALRIYPVIDLQGGIVVRAAGGDRTRYRPLWSRLAPSPQPLAVARAFRGRLGLERLYAADLDALGGAPPSADVLCALAGDGFRLLVDAGCRSAPDARRILDLGAEEVIAPLETLPGPAALAEIIAAAGPERVVFSLDLRGSAPVGDAGAWPAASAAGIASEAWRLGARRILVLDLARVGGSAGPGHLDLLRRLREELPGVEILAGGGIRAAADLQRLEEAGAAAALVATAFHEGALPALP